MHDEDAGEAVDDEAGQPIGFGMNKPIIGQFEESVAQPQRALEPTRKKAPADRPAGVAI